MTPEERLNNMIEAVEKSRLTKNAIAYGASLKNPNTLYQYLDGTRKSMILSNYDRIIDFLASCN